MIMVIFSSLSWVLVKLWHKLYHRHHLSSCSLRRIPRTQIYKQIEFTRWWHHRRGSWAGRGIFCMSYNNFYYCWGSESHSHRCTLRATCFVCRTQRYPRLAYLGSRLLSIGTKLSALEMCYTCEGDTYFLLHDAPTEGACTEGRLAKTSANGLALDVAGRGRKEEESKNIIEHKIICMGIWTPH